MEQETHEKYFYGTEHWNYFTNDEDLGPVILSLKQETINGRDQFRYLHAVGSSVILKAKEKLCVTFNFGKHDVIDFMKFSKMTMCRASEANSEK